MIGFRSNLLSRGLPLALAAGLAVPALALEEVKIFVRGGTDEMGQAIESASLLVSNYRDGVTAPVDLLAAARADYARIVGAMYAQGHYGPTVSIKVDGREAADISPLSAPDTVSRIIAEVVPGPSYRFSRAEIGPLGWNTELPEEYAVGQVARTGAIQSAVDTAISDLRDLGHAKADVAGQTVTANHAARTLAADVRLAPGPVLKFGQLRISGETRVSERRIRQIAGLPTGEVFSPDDLRRAGRRLRDTGVFRAAALSEAETANADGTLDIDLQLEDQAPRRFGFGAEYATDDGVTLSAFWLHRNLFGEALRFRLGGEIAGIAGQTGGEDYKLTLDLSRPATFGSRTDAFFKGEIFSLSEPEFESDAVRLTFGATRRHTDFLTLQAAIRFAYSDETDDTGDTEYSQIFLPFRATLDKRDSPLNTLDGFFVEGEISPFLGFNDSDSGARLTGDLRYYEDIGPESRFVIAARVQLGAIAGASLTGVPNDLRFYSGGGGTVRGQEYQSLGVMLPGGGDSGGRSFLGVQSELRARVTDNISVVGFFDWGTVSADSVPGSGGDSHSGAGFGIRYDTGIGPIRFDLAVPVSGENEGDDFQIYIGVGQAF